VVIQHSSSETDLLQRIGTAIDTGNYSAVIIVHHNAFDSSEPILLNVGTRNVPWRIPVILLGSKYSALNPKDVKFVNVEGRLASDIHGIHFTVNPEGSTRFSRFEYSKEIRVSRKTLNLMIEAGFSPKPIGTQTRGDLEFAHSHGFRALGFYDG